MRVSGHIMSWIGQSNTPDRLLHMLLLRWETQL